MLYVFDKPNSYKFMKFCGMSVTFLKISALVFSIQAFGPLTVLCEYSI